MAELQPQGRTEMSRLFPEPWMRWYDLPGLRRLALARFSFMRKRWMPGHRRLARLRLLYWVLFRGVDTEICKRCGGPVGIVFHVPDAIWEMVTGFARYPDGEAAPGILCIPCVDALYRKVAQRGDAGYLRWTCVTDDSIWPRSGARVAEGSGLLSRPGSNVREGSNPSPTASETTTVAKCGVVPAPISVGDSKATVAESARSGLHLVSRKQPILPLFRVRR